MTTEVQDFYLAALCAYSGYPLIEIRTEGRDTGFVFDKLPSWSLEELKQAYDSPEGQPLSSARHFCEALAKLAALQKRARQNPDGIWVNKHWQTMGKEADEVDCGTWK